VLYVNFPYLEGVLGAVIGSTGFFLGWGLNEIVLGTLFMAIGLVMLIDAKMRSKGKGV
jgi:hypothetical protein